MNLEILLEKIKSLDLPERNLTARDLLKRIYLSDFYLFSKYFLGYKDLEREVHGQFIKVFESSASKKIVVMPRGTFKSSLGSISYPQWRLFRNPNITSFLASELYTNSKNFLREIKAHLVSEKTTHIFGDQVGLKWDEGEIILKTRTQNRKEASITVGGIETVKVGCHYDLIVCDDLNSPTNSDTPEKCQKVIDYVRYLLSVLNPGGELVLIGTRYSERDVIGFFLGEVLGETKLAEGKMERTEKIECEKLGLLEDS